jgi:hypothetical protein
LDPVLKKLSQHFCRFTRYPKIVKDNNREGAMYFSLSVDANGGIRNLQVYEQPPSEASEIKKVVVISYYPDSTVSAAQNSNEEINNAIRYEIKRAWEKKPDLSGLTPGSPQYFFKVEYRLQGTPSVTT